MSDQLFVFFALIMIIEGVISFICLTFYFVLNDKINRIEDMLREYIKNENELYNCLLLDKIRSKAY